MFRIRLINMPFGALQFPSLALTQLKSVTERRCGASVDIQILYLNHDFAHLTGVDLYQEIAGTMRHHLTGVGDWLFRRCAFPQAPDNSREFFLRCYPQREAGTQRFRSAVSTIRDQVDAWLDEVIARHELERASLVGFTSMFNQNLASFALARKLKDHNADLTTVIGGANCEYPMGAEIAGRLPCLDFVFSGLALTSFPQLVQHLVEGRKDDCHRINGVFSKRNKASAPVAAEAPGIAPAEQAAPVGAFGDELDINVPVPLDYHEFLETIARQFPPDQVSPSLLFETSRGCWWGERAHCTFCGLNGMVMKYRLMEPERALRQFAELFAYARHVPHLMLQCVDNIMPESYLQDVFPKLQTPSNVTMFYELRSNLSERHVEVLSRAGVTRMQPGIESLASSTLKLMAKGTTSFQNLALLKLCELHGIDPHWNLLVGFPGESARVFEKYVRDLPRVVHLFPPTGVYPVRFDRFSPYFMNPGAFGLDLRPYDFYELLYPWDRAALGNVAYYFIDDNFKADYLVQMVKWLPRLVEHVERWQRRYDGADGAPRAALFLRQTDEQAVIVDTRTPSNREYPVGETGLRLLPLLEQPMSRNRLVAALDDVDPGEIDRELARFEEHGLLFEEDGRLLSLVLRRRPSRANRTSAEAASSSLSMTHNQNPATLQARDRTPAAASRPATTAK